MQNNLPKQHAPAAMGASVPQSHLLGFRLITGPSGKAPVMQEYGAGIAHLVMCWARNPSCHIAGSTLIGAVQLCISSSSRSSDGNSSLFDEGGSTS